MRGGTIYLNYSFSLRSGELLGRNRGIVSNKESEGGESGCGVGHSFGKQSGMEGCNSAGEMVLSSECRCELGSSVF